MKHTFTKYDVTGNIFLLCRSRASLAPAKRRSEYGALARKMCASLTGAGADGLLALSPAKEADFTLDVFNADGSWAERSGNGLRAAAVFAQKEFARRKNWRVYCGGDYVTASVLQKISKNEWQVEAEVGYPEFDESSASLQLKELALGAKRIKYLPVIIGNPHAVVPVKTFPGDWVALGKRISGNRRFADGVNVEFVKVVNRRRLEIRIFERGVGPTGSSGTGASASVAAMNALGMVSGNVIVDCLDENDSIQRLDVNWSDVGKAIVVSGSVKQLFTIQVSL